MSESESTVAATSPAGQDSPAVEPQSQKQDPKKAMSSGLSLSIWPPTQRTRDAVITRLIETLSAPSVLSKRYGTIPQEEADAAARSIEEEAFGVANAAASAEDDGLEILQLYSKEISKRMLDTVKARSGPASMVDNSASETASPAAPPLPVGATTEEVSGSVDTDA
uniref:WPP domain-containing protein n=1 Tax=Rhizophora mucronata TaxID=61149 RepID=A0A2P2IQ98_RHIMU